jgi:hypothetical protein
MDIPPGYLLLDGDYGQFEALEHLYTLEVERGECAEAERTWTIWKQAVQGFAPVEVPVAPNCP